VVIAIIGTLVALLLPAVQSAREAARRGACVNNSHNLALAVLNFEAANGFMPMGTHRRASGVPPPPWQTNQISWIARVLPYLEQMSLYDQIDFEIEPGDKPVGPDGPNPNVVLMGAPLDIVRCPSDAGTERLEGWITDGGHSIGDYAPTNYVACMGDNDDAWLYTGMFGINSDTRIGQITDGTSNSMMLSECKIADPFIKYYGNGLYFKCRTGTARDIPTDTYQVEPRGFSWFYAQVNQAWNYNTFLTPNDPLVTNHECQMWSEKTSFAARSRHPGGVNVALGDGSVRFVVDEVDYDTWQYLGAIQDGEPVGEY